MRPWLGYLIGLLAALGLGYYFDRVHPERVPLLACAGAVGFCLCGLMLNLPRRGTSTFRR